MRVLVASECWGVSSRAKAWGWSSVEGGEAGRYTFLEWSFSSVEGGDAGRYTFLEWNFVVGVFRWPYDACTPPDSAYGGVHQLHAFNCMFTVGVLFLK